MGDVTIRAATPADGDRMEQLLNEPPDDAMVALTGGDPVRARRAGAATVRLGFTLHTSHCVVAEQDGQVVGVMESGADVPDVRFGLRTVAAAMKDMVVIFGPLGALRLLRNMRVAARVDAPRVPGSYYIAEIDVDPACRNQGIGSALLTYAEERARAAGVRQMSLNTLANNPARRLYERHGYSVVQAFTDPEYERITGIPGRLLMVKDLS